MVLPFVQGVAQGLGTATAIWMVGRFLQWSGLRLQPGPSKALPAALQNQSEQFEPSSSSSSSSSVSSNDVSSSSSNNHGVAQQQQGDAAPTR